MNSIAIGTTPAVSFKGPWVVNEDSKKEVKEQFQDGGKKIMDGLSALAAGAKTMVKKPIAKYTSSAPNITNTQNNVHSEYQRLRNSYVETVAKLEEDGFEPAIDKNGLFVTLNVPYSGVIQNTNGSLVEYKDGKPMTMVVNESCGDYINQRLIKYEYPEGSIAALKTETSVINEYSHELGYSKAVPKSIREEVGIDI